MELLEKHFDIAFDGPNGIPRLREVILTLGMQGKLVKQSPDDLSACGLLREIELEKQILAKEGKIKKPTPISIVKPEEAPYKLPDSWIWSRLGDCMLKITDGTHRSPSNTETGDFLYISAKNIKNEGVLLKNATYVTEEIHEEIYSRCDPEYGNILYIKDGATTGIATINNLHEPFSMLSSVALLKQPAQINNTYLLLALRSPFFYNSMRADMSGVAITRVTLAKLNSAIIPLPPLAEQRRIVAKIDQLMARCDELGKLRMERDRKKITVHTAALNRLLTAPDTAAFTQSWQFITQHFTELYSVKENVAELRKAILQLAVIGKLVPQNSEEQSENDLLEEIQVSKEKIVKEGKLKRVKKTSLEHTIVLSELPKSWRWSSLETVCETIVDCPHSTPKFVPSGIICIDTNSFKNGKIIPHKLRYVSEETFMERTKRLVPVADDLIFAREGSVGELVIVPSEFPCCLGQRVMLFRPMKGISPKYLQLSISNNYFLNRILSFSKGIGAKHVNVRDMKQALVSIPPLAEQHRIVTKVDQLMTLCDNLEQQIDAASHKQTDLLNAVLA